MTALKTLTVNKADEKEPKRGSLSAQVLAPMIAKTAITRKRIRRAPETGSRLASRALRMSRSDLMRLMSRMTRNARKSLRPDPSDLTGFVTNNKSVGIRWELKI